ncbi:MAG: glycosyltransferase family 2 protein [Elusimicrobia bacterium]|nr:glycosyltransferase family 2 protein [Elusimicrobiota bacterium]
MTPAELSINIVNYNNRQYLLDCLKSIYENIHRVKFSVLVIDNNSTDNSTNLIQNKYPLVKILKNEKNIGFAKAHNIGFKLTDAKYILILNPDTLVVDDSIEKMVEYLEQNSKVGIVGPKILNPDRSLQYTGTKYPNNMNLLFETFFLDKFFPNSKLFGRHKGIYDSYSETAQKEYLQGSCLMMKKQVLADIGFFDEIYFMYFEETDLCYRANKKDWQICRLGNTSIVHFGGGETGFYDEFRIYQYYKSMLLFYEKHYSGVSIYILKSILFVRTIIRLFLWTPVGFFHKIKRRESVSRTKGYLKLFSLLLKS